MAESLSCYNQLEEDTGLQFNFFSSPSGKFSQNNGRSALLLFGMPILLIFGIVPNCRTTSQCEGWNNFYPTDLEFNEALTNATLRGASCYSAPLPSRITDLSLLDGVDPYSDLSLEMDCSVDSSTLQDQATRGHRYVRMLDLSRNEPVDLLARFIRTESGCGLVVRPQKPLQYETFYALYLMRGPATDSFDEPRDFRRLKWKAFRNNIDTETDELYRDALNQASERWGTHPDSFRMIQAFTTRSFRSVSIPSITLRNQYFAASQTLRFISSLDQSSHPLANFMLDAHHTLLQENAADFAAPGNFADQQSGETHLLTIALRNIQSLSGRTGLRSGFAEITGACTTMPEPELCNYQEVELPELHLRYIPYLYSQDLARYSRILIMPLDVFSSANRVEEIKSWSRRLASKSIGLVIYLGPAPERRINEPDHLQKELLQGAFSLSALPANNGSQISLYCEETVYCPMMGLYSRNVSSVVGPGSFEYRPGSIRQSFPPQSYRAIQLKQTVMAPFQFQSFLLDRRKTLIALRKSQFHVRSSNDLDAWFPAGGEEK
ncbi:MAG TPA: hypothetical protein DEA96_16610 [Leptospiraceae bacterium]|nr:hypothetical protein [Leptospiraceae bacterium]